MSSGLVCLHIFGTDVIYTIWNFYDNYSRQISKILTLRKKIKVKKGGVYVSIGTFRTYLYLYYDHQTYGDRIAGALIMGWLLNPRYCIGAGKPWRWGFIFRLESTTTWICVNLVFRDQQPFKPLYHSGPKSVSN